MKNHQRISQPTALPDGGDVWHVVLSSKMYRRVAVERSQCTSISPHKCMLDWSNSDQVEEPLDPSMSKYFIWWGSQSQRKLFWLCTWIQKWNKNKIKSQNHLLFWKLKGKMESPNPHCHSCPARSDLLAKRTMIWVGISVEIYVLDAA